MQLLVLQILAVVVALHLIQQHQMVGQAVQELLLLPMLVGNVAQVVL
jgi:hypothetical protein